MLSDEAIKDQVYSMLEERKARVDAFFEKVKPTWFILHWDVRTMANYTDVLLVISYNKAAEYPSVEHDKITEGVAKIEGVHVCAVLNAGFRARTYFIRLCYDSTFPALNEDYEWHWKTTYDQNNKTHVINFLNK